MLKDKYDVRSVGYLVLHGSDLCFVDFEFFSEKLNITSDQRSLMPCLSDQTVGPVLCRVIVVSMNGSVGFSTFYLFPQYLSHSKTHY